MIESTWLPGLVVLAAGLLVGLALAFRFRGEGVKPTNSRSTPPDLSLKIRDLEARRDDLYRRIRAADEDKLGAEEVTALEGAAANTLRELDVLTGQLPPAAMQETAAKEKQEGDAGSPTQTATEEPQRQTSRTKNPLLMGFAFGAAMVAVISLLVYWAVKDAQPSAPMGPQPTQTSASGEPPHEGQVEVSPELAAQITDLQSQLVTDPQNWLAKKQLALSYVDAGQFFEAFSEASQVLQQFPDDPDGLLVHGIVRLTMGQAEQAVGLLDQVLAQHPDHRQALIYRGLALYQSGQVERALDTWEMGLQLVGGSDPELEELIHMAQSGATQPAGMMPADHPSGSPPVPQSSAGAAGPATQELDPNGYSLSLDLASGVQVAPQSTLFIFLRPEAGGPPVAARRVTLPSFPVQIILGLDDSMMGAELPDSGILVARLDADGNVATSDASDLAVEVLATKGQRVSLTLGQ